ncbi:MAG: archaeal proteasome endopeptidase complex subunit alpha [Candidatus Diapherotrites archaeon]|nr:archaeal proteasome endopeptidase complex subunit alpha [Candidatus Diapherotrites archaeon]
MYSPVSAQAYDRAITVFSPDGNLYQVEYAGKAVEKGTLGVGLIYDKGVLLAADKKVSSKLVVEESIEKISMIDFHIGTVSSGLVADARRIVEYSREKAQENNIVYSEPINVETLTKEICTLKQMYTQYGGTRPFGISFLIAGVDNTGIRLFETLPSGTLTEYKAVAVGMSRSEVMDLFESKYKENKTKDEVATLAIQALDLVTEDEKLNEKRVDMAFVDSETKKFTKVEKDQIAKYISKSGA